MPELLLELGCEELPATAVRRAYTDLQANVEAALTGANVAFRRAHEPIGTPRRLIVHLADVAATQPDSEKESRGPALEAAFDASGAPSKALEGFCRGQGVEPSQVERRDGYVWVTKKVIGRPTAELLADILPQAIQALNFDKTMRWGSGRMRFARPIRWILATFDGAVVPFEIEGATSGAQSRGHRFYAPESFEVTTYDALLTELMKRKVEPNPVEREKTIREVATIVASGKPQFSDALVDENVFLTEWPTPIEGSFDASFLSLPEPALITAMAKHEKMFPVRDSANKLVNKFVFVRNSGEDDSVRKGAEWVLNARFNDAQFFYKEDQKWRLDDFLKRTEQIVFQDRLGTVRQRADRLSNLAAWIADQTGADVGEAKWAETAGLYAKADLATGLVGELASLQGIVGGSYAQREGFADAVCAAIAGQYDPAQFEGRDDPAARTALRLILADQVDKLAGYLGTGQIPTGSSDPYGLRRAATQCIEATWKRWDLDFAGLISVAVTLYARQDVDLDVEVAKTAAKDLFVGRYQALLEPARHDHIAAATMESYGWSAMQPKRVLDRLGLIQTLAGDTAWVQTASRPLNILRSAKEKGEAFATDEPLKALDRAALASDSAAALASALDAVSIAPKAYDPAHASLLKSLAAPINAFFDATMVMSPEAKERSARLTLVAACCDVLLTAGDVSKIVVEGG